MQQRFKDFQQKRMEIFRELIKRQWEKPLTNEDLEIIADEIIRKYGYQDEDAAFVKDHIRVAMGQNPNQQRSFTDEAEILQTIPQVTRPILTKIEGACKECGENYEECDCYDVCKYEAQMYKRSTGPMVIEDKCLSCGRCTITCSFGALADKIEFLPLLNLLNQEGVKVYASVAPSIVGQFGDNISMGQLRTAFKLMGFEDMVETALFADILTIKEAFEFNKLVTNKEDFFLTSCCCPVWLNLVFKNYPDLTSHMSPSVSPMIASGRFLKKLYPGIKVVFISPCTAKKAEAKDPLLEDAIDFVLTYNELKEIFTVIGVDLQELPEDDKDHASFAGRVYARTGGVSLSVKTVVNRIAPDRLIHLRAKKVHGVKQCKAILDQLKQGVQIGYNFIEGMGCEGGCIGGPKTNISVDQARQLVNAFGEDSLIMTPMDNLNILKIISEFGVNHYREIADNRDITLLLARDRKRAEELLER